METAQLDRNDAVRSLIMWTTVLPVQLWRPAEEQALPVDMESGVLGGH